MRGRNDGHKSRHEWQNTGQPRMSENVFLYWIRNSDAGIGSEIGRNDSCVMYAKVKKKLYRLDHPKQT